MRRPTVVQPINRRRNRMPGLLTGVLVDSGEVHVGESGQRAVVVPHDGYRTGDVDACAIERIQESYGASIVRRHQRGGQVALAEQRLSSARASLFGVVARDDPNLVVECRAHLNGYRSASTVFDPDLPDVRLVAVADAHEPFAVDAAKRYGYQRAETSWEAIVAAPDIDTVSVVGGQPPAPRDRRGSFGGRQAVLCEKPLAPSVADAQTHR